MVCLFYFSTLPVGRAPALPACRFCRPGGCGGGAELQILLSQSFPPDRLYSPGPEELLRLSPHSWGQFLLLQPPEYQTLRLTRRASILLRLSTPNTQVYHS